MDSKGKMPWINILVISVTNLLYYKDYSPLGLHRIDGKAANSALPQWQNPPLTCFRNPYLPILKTSLRAACPNRANLGKTSWNPVSSYNGQSMGSSSLWRGFSWHLILCFGSSLFPEQLLWAHLGHTWHTQHHPLHKAQPHQGLSATAAGLELQRAISQPQGFSAK